MLTRWYWQHFNHLINSIKIKCGRASTRTTTTTTTVPTTHSGIGDCRGTGAAAETSWRGKWGPNWSKLALCTHSMRQSLNQSVHQSVNQAFDKSQSWQWAKRRRKKKGSIVEFDFSTSSFSSFCAFAPSLCSPSCCLCCVSILKASNHSGVEYAECVIKLAALQLTQLISCRRKEDCRRIITILQK